ncbi:MAG: hypothetical protein J5928_04275 [Firmicutes bacterium]|nr:hypothetical protein [Bacillota bacterium]
MADNKKRIIESLVFILLVAVCWVFLQAVFSYNWDTEHVSAKYESYVNAEDGSIDVLWIGTSNTYSDICPVVIWHNSGITSFNMGTANNVSLFEYYQLKYLIKHNKPKIVAIDFSGASVEESPDKYAQFEPTYRKMAETMPDLGIRLSMIRDFCKKYESLDMPSFLLPLLRYHARWEELKAEDWDVFSGNDSYSEYRKGAYFSTNVEPKEFAPDLFTRKTEAVPLYAEYYQMIYDLCHDEGIDVFVTLLPNVRQRYADYEMAKEFAETNKLNIAAFTTVQSMQIIGLDAGKHFYDNEHLNIIGQNIFSAYIGEYIAKIYGLTDHRGDEAYSDWDMWYDEYFEKYDKRKEEVH